MTRLLSRALGACLLLTAATGSAAVLDFEGFGAGTIVDDEYAASGVRISAETVSGLNLAVVFDTDNPTGGDSDLGAPFSPVAGNPFGVLSPGNVLILQENGPCNDEFCDVPDDEGARPAGKFIIQFNRAVTLNSIDFFDIEMDESGPGPENRIVLVGENGDILPLAFFTPDTGGDNQWDRLSFDVAGVRAIVLNMGGSGAIDNIDFSPVPVPAALPLLLSALGGLGLARRRRKG